MMVRMGDADALVSGVTQNYPDTIRPALSPARATLGAQDIAFTAATHEERAEAVTMD